MNINEMINELNEAKETLAALQNHPQYAKFEENIARLEYEVFQAMCNESEVAAVKWLLNMNKIEIDVHEVVEPRFYRWNESNALSWKDSKHSHYVDFIEKWHVAEELE